MNGKKGLEKAVKKAGGTRALARAIKTYPNKITYARQHGVSAGLAMAIHKAYPDISFKELGFDLEL